MKAKHLLTGLVLPTVFAACTSEEIVSQQDVVKSDLSNRPVVGKVELNLGGMESRGTVGDPYFNSIAFVEGEDGFGARIIDTYSPISLAGDKVLDHAVRNYAIVDEYASSNYKYVNNGGKSWVTDALMVEGNYMFYYPYNEANLARTPNKVVLPLKQVVKPNEEDGYRNPIKDLYEGENPAIVGYTFLKATDQEATVSPALHHVFAYPQITLTNDYTYDHDNDGDTPEIGKEMTITKIVLYSSNFQENGTINHTSLVTNLRDFSVDAIEDYGADWFAYNAGDWNKNTKDGAYAALTGEIVEWSTGDNDGSIEITFEGGLTLSPEESYSFNFVAPAAEYDEIQMKVLFADDKMFDKTVVIEDVTFASSKRYPTEEYNFPTNGTPSVKESAGSLATVEFAGQTLIKTVEDAEWIDDINEFEAYLKTIKDNTANITEATDLSNVGTDGQFAFARTNSVARMKLNAAVVELVNKYLANGTVTFRSKMQVEDTEEAVTLNDMTFNGGLDILAGEVVAQGATLAAGKQVTVKGGTLTIPANSTSVLKNVVVEGGELVANKVAFDLATAGKNTTAETTGKITLKEGCVNYLTNQVLGSAINLAGGELVIGEEVIMRLGGSITSLTTGKITNEGEILVATDYTIGENVTLDNKGTVSFENTAVLTNNGTINNYKDLIVTNLGTINMKEESATLTVSGEGGNVDNTVLGYVEVVGHRDNQTVWYVYESDVTNAEADEFEYNDGYSINALKFKNAQFSMTEEVAIYQNLGWIKAIAFDGGSLYVKGEHTVNISEIFVNGTVSMTGWGNANESKLTVRNIDESSVARGQIAVTLAENAQLTVSKLTLDGSLEGINFVGEGTGNKQGKVTNNGIVKIGAGSTTNVAWAGVAAE